MLRNFLLTGVAVSQPTGCKATKNEHLTKFHKVVLQKDLCNGSSFQYIAGLQTTPAKFPR